MDPFLSMNLGLPTGEPEEVEEVAEKPASDPSEALTAAADCYAKGDHAGAKSHALKAVNALHKASKSPPTP